MAQATNTNSPSYIVVNSQEGQNPQVSTHGTMAAAAKEFKRALREDVYYASTLSIHQAASSGGKAVPVKGWVVSYVDGEFYNHDTGANVDCRDITKGEKFSGQKLAPLFPKA